MSHLLHGELNVSNCQNRCVCSLMSLIMGTLSCSAGMKNKLRNKLQRVYCRVQAATGACRICVLTFFSWIFYFIYSNQKKENMKYLLKTSFPLLESLRASRSIFTAMSNQWWTYILNFDTTLNLEVFVTRPPAYSYSVSKCQLGNVLVILSNHLA